MTEVRSTDRFAELTRACAHTGGVVSYQSAAQVYAMGDFHPHFVHVTAAGLQGSRGADGTVAIHRERLHSTDICDLGLFRVTTPLRTVLDLAASPVSHAVLDRVVADAIAIGRVAVDDLSSAAQTEPARVEARLRRALHAAS